MMHVETANMYCDYQLLAKDADRAPESDRSHFPQVIVVFVRSARECPQDKADAEFKAVMREMGVLHL